MRRGTKVSWVRVGMLATALLAGACSPAPPPPGDPGAGTEGQGGLQATSPLRIETAGAPAAIGPYSQGVLAGNTLYLAGQIALDPATGELVDGGIEAETRQVMQNLEAVLVAAGLGFDEVVQAQVFLVDLADFAAMNEVYAEYFGDVPPARATVGVASLPRGARVEIMLTAVR